MATNPLSLPLYDKIRRKNTIPRTVEVLLLFLLFSLIVYRVFTLHEHGVAWLVALLCESWFTFIWILVVAIKWTMFDYKTYPQRLLQRISELPRVDMFVTTADAVLEPPILTVNTVLSLLAVDYPPNKLACYVSDDACSPLIFYSLVEATKFAKLWIPFCKKYEVSVRAPFRYFSAKSSPYHDGSSIEFQQEWKRMKDGYEELCRKIEEKGSEKSMACDDFGDVERNNHPTIIKVISEYKEGDIPIVVYISREKRPNHPHHYKAGAMNVLTRVSGLMTNAQFMLNVDCDMYANNPQIVLHAICLLLGVKKENESGFVQFPQSFYDGIKDDPFGNQMVVLYEYMGRGIAGIQGPFYGGTGCFHRRKVIYGLSPEDSNKEIFDEAELQGKYGRSLEFGKSVVPILCGSTKIKDDESVSLNNLEAANQVAGIGYEFGTSWGKQIGWIYGSTTEDVLTGLTIHGRGWKSEYLPLEPVGFLGCAPSGGPASTTQMKRWATGLFEILFTSKTPLIATLNGKLQFRQCLAYLWILVWAVRSIPEILYAILPSYCIITNTSFLPKINEDAILLPIGIFVIYNVYTLSEYLRMGESVRAWWNNQRMWRVNAMTAWLFGLLSVILKLIGLSQTVFEITQKDQTNNEDDNNVNVNVGRYTFDGSPIFLSGTSILLVNLAALATVLLGFRSVGNGVGVGEILTSTIVVLYFWVFFKGLFAKGKYGIPSSTILKALVLVLLFLHFCKWGTIS